MRALPLIAAAALLCGGCGSEHAVRIHVTPATSLLDAPLSIRVTGLHPGSRVAIVAREHRWSARAAYRAAADGTVDLARLPSRGGSFTGRHPMGLLWSLRPLGGLATPTPYDGGRVVFEVMHGSNLVAETSVVRRPSAPGVRSRKLDVHQAGFYGRYFAPPPDGGRHPSVVIFGGSEGGLSTEPDARLLASHGYPTLALAYFAEPGLPKELGRIPLEYFAGAIRWLDRRPSVDPGRVVAYGESRGSEAALLLGVHYPQLVNAVIGIVPSSEVNAGNVTYGIGIVPAWTMRGKPIAFTGVQANIPVERIHGPILVAGGGRDLVWPSYYHAKDIAERSREHGGPRVIVRNYPDAGHFGYAAPYLPSADAFVFGGTRHPLGGTAAANAAARADLWPRILRFLRGVPEAHG